MESPYKFVLVVLIFWIVLGGILQVFDTSGVDGDTLNVNDDKEVTLVGDNSFLSKISFIWDLMTFNVNGMPDGFSFGLTTFFTSALLLSILVLIRGQ